MDIILIILLVLLVGIASSILYINLKSKTKDDNENKEAEEIANLKTEIQNLRDTLNNTIDRWIFIVLFHSDSTFLACGGIESIKY